MVDTSVHPVVFIEVDMWTALRIRPHIHRLYDGYDDGDLAGLSHQLPGLILQAQSSCVVLSRVK